MRSLPEVRLGRALLWAVIAGFVLTLPMWLSTSRINLATIIVIFGIVAASLVVLTGWAGQVSLGQMAFVGLGAGVGGALTELRGWDMALAMAVAGAVGAAAAVIVGFPALRRRGLTLAVSTLAFGLFVSSYLLNRTVYPINFLGFEIPEWLPSRRFDRGTMLGIDASSETAMFYIALAVLALSLLMVVGWRRSRTGRVLIAIRENEKAALAYGVNVTRTSLAAFAFSGFLAAIAGVLYVQHANGLSSDPYLPVRSLELFTMVVIGGLGSLPGALLGAVYVQGVDFFLPAEWQFLATGAGLLLVLLLMPSGFGGVLADVRDGALRRIARRRGLMVPSLLADVRVEEPAEAPPEEDVLAAAGERAEEAEAEAVAAAEPEPAGVSPPGGRAGHGADGDAVEARR
jgi:branched-chain amino acid transport system permease protein